MPRVSFTQNLQRHVELPPSEVEGASVREALDKVFADKPQARSYVLDERGALRQHMIIFVDGESVRDRETLGDPVKPDSDIQVFQALSGG